MPNQFPLGDPPRNDLREALRQRFLSDLAAKTQPLVEPADVMATTARMFAEYLGVDRCAYATVEDESVFVITGDHARDVPSIVGRWPVAAFGPECVRCMLAGEPFVVHDVDHTPEIGPEHVTAYRATTIAAVICVPLLKNGVFTAAMAVHQKVPRQWRDDEVALVSEVVARCWEALERARVERTLIESRARMEYAVQLSGVGFWYCDLPFDELHWDARVRDHFFLTADERVTLDTFYERIHLDDRATTRAAIEQSINERTSYDIVYRTINREGSAMKFVRALGGTTYAPDGTPTRFDDVTVDVTTQRLDQERLTQALHREREAAERLREQDRRKNEFLATLAHELRNPLAPVRTGLQVLRAGASEAQIRKTHEMMERQLRHMVRMIDDLLEVSRVTLGKVTLRMERIDLRDVVHSALETTRPLIDAARHELAVRFPEMPLVLEADPTRLAQVFSNLLNNAAKYTPQGGRIELRAEVDRHELTVRVTDTGVGIAPEMAESVFEMFRQLGPAGGSTSQGLGIGLTLARRLVELHGGTITAESDGIGFGTTCIVRLRLAALATRAEPAPAPSEQPASVLRVLVVDDNEDAAESLAMLLELSGHTTRTAHSGRDALTAALSFRPQVVFLDIGLPEMNGYEVARRIRAEAELQQPMLIALTGWGAEEDKREAKAAGFDLHLVKPFDARRLDDILAARVARP